MVHDFKIYHGDVTDTGLWFSTDIVDVCKEFLRSYPSETIIMSVKDEWGSTQNFENNLLQYLPASICLHGDSVPTLAEARSKIVLFRRYEFGTAGIPARNGWPALEGEKPGRGQFTVPGGTELMVQDVYGISFKEAKTKSSEIRRKWMYVEAYLNGAFMNRALTETQTGDDRGFLLFPSRTPDNPPVDRWWINFSSASGAPTVINPLDFAKGNWGDPGVNASIRTFLHSENPGSYKKAKVGHYGTVIMDFPDQDLITKVICTNEKVWVGIGGLHTKTWMSTLPDTIMSPTLGKYISSKLNIFTIPGTHDTGTWPLSDTVAGVTNNAKCQSLDLKAQLEAGIRFLDIRVVQRERQ